MAMIIDIQTFYHEILFRSRKMCLHHHHHRHGRYYKQDLLNHSDHLQHSPIRFQWVNFFDCSFPMAIRQILWLMYSLYEVFRENMIYYLLKTGNGQWFFTLDRVAYEFVNLTRFNADIFISWGSLAWFYLYLLLSLNYTDIVDYRIIEHLNEIIVGIWQQFWQQNPMFNIDFSWTTLCTNKVQNVRKFFYYLNRNKIKMRTDYNDGDDVDDEKKSKSHSNLIYLNEQNRLQILKFMVVNEILRTQIVGTTLVFLLLGTFVYIINVYSRYTIIGIIMLFVHFFIQLSLILDVVKQGFFVVFSLKIICSVYNILFNHCSTRIHQLRTQMQKFNTKHGYRLVADVEVIYFRLHQIRKYHNRLTQFIAYFNHRFISRILFTFMLTNLPPNIYMITYIWLNPADFINQLFINCTIALQLIALLFFIWPMMKLNASIYSFAKYLFPLQIVSQQQQPKCMMNEDHRSSIRIIKHKIKLLQFYEQTHSESKFVIGFTIGPLDLVTRYIAYKVRLKILN